MKSIFYNEEKTMGRLQLYTTSMLLGLPFLLVAQELNPVKKDNEPLRSLGVLQAEAKNLAGCAFSPDGKQLAVADGDSISFWNVKTKKPVGQPWLQHRTAAGPATGIHHLAYSPDGQYMATLSRNISGRSLCVWEIKSKQLLWRMDRDVPMWTFAFSPKDKEIAIVDFRHLYVCNVATGKQRLHFDIDPGIKSFLAYAPDGKTLIFNGYGYRTVRLFDTEKDVQKSMIEIVDWPSCITVSRDGKKLIVGNWNVPIRTYDLTGKKTACPELPHKHPDAIHVLNVFEKDRILVSADRKGNVYLWNLETGQELLSRRARDGVYACTADGKILALAEKDGNISLWDITPLKANDAGDPHSARMLRYHAVKALAAIGPAAQKAIPEIRKALADPDSLVRREAKKALERLETTEDN